MKYTARHIQRFIEQGRIDPALWKNHFPTLLPTQVPTCEDCGEFGDRTCAGGRDPVECFLAKKTGAGGESGAEGDRAARKRKTKDPMIGRGVRKIPIPGGANKTHDQSKM